MGLLLVISSTEALKLCIFDLRWGQHEGQELEKILFFFPVDMPFSTQLSVIGLSEGLIMFTRLFSPEAACEVIEAEMHSHIFHEAEPDIWMVLIVEKNKETEAIWRSDALRKVLVEIHSLFVLFHGSIRALLDIDPGGGLIRAHLYSFISDYMLNFLIGNKIQLPNFRDSLKERGSVQMLTVSREAAIEVQSLVRVLESCTGSASCYSLILFQDLLVSTTLSPADTINVFSYAILRLSPRALSSGASSWFYLRKGYAAAHAADPTSMLESTGSGFDQFYSSHEFVVWHINHWFGKWCYRFWHGSFGVTEDTYDKVMNGFKNTVRGGRIEQLVRSYRRVSESQLVAIGDLFPFILAFNSTTVALIVDLLNENRASNELGKTSVSMSDFWMHEIMLETQG